MEGANGAKQTVAMRDYADNTNLPDNSAAVKSFQGEKSKLVT
jgi:hypothetical protein